MTRYRANAVFGPWRPGDVFESEDEFHAVLAEEGRLLTRVGGRPFAFEEALEPSGPPNPPGAAPSEDDGPADAASDVEAAQDEEST